MPPKKRKQIDNTLIKPDDYLNFLKDVKLKGVGLDSAATSVDRARLGDALSKREELLANLKVDLSIINRSKDEFIVRAIFELIQHTASNEIPIVTIASTFSALFGFSKIPDKQFTDRFAQAEARLVFWPYLRHFISDMSYRMSIPQILIPLTSESSNSAEIKENPSIKKNQQK